jgi:hypothetical protein
MHIVPILMISKNNEKEIFHETYQVKHMRKSKRSNGLKAIQRKIELI